MGFAELSCLQSGRSARPVDVAYQKTCLTVLCQKAAHFRAVLENRDDRFGFLVPEHVLASLHGVWLAMQTCTDQVHREIQDSDCLCWNMAVLAACNPAA